MNIQEQEEIDYQMGSKCELQNALALSQMERIVRDDSAEIKKLVAEGKFVVAMSHPVYCSRTDAPLGEDIWIEEICDYRSEAMDHFNRICGDIGDSDYGVTIYPIARLETVPAKDLVDLFLADDCPF